MRHLVLVLTLLGCAPLTAGTVTDLFISEYVEGTSNTKAIEIYNGTGAAVDLSAYRIVMYFGNTTNSLPVDLQGTLAPNDVHVLAHSSSGLPADQMSGGGWFNGNDAIVLWKGGTIIDSIGSRAFPAPDIEWGGGVVSTADNTLRRKPSICSPRIRRSVSSSSATSMPSSSATAISTSSASSPARPIPPRR